MESGGGRRAAREVGEWNSYFRLIMDLIKQPKFCELNTHTHTHTRTHAHTHTHTHAHTRTHAHTHTHTHTHTPADPSYTDPLGDVPQKRRTAARAKPAEEDEFEGVELGDDLLPE